jgi:hypothetical protein
VHAAHEAWRQLQAHPHQPGRFLQLIQITQRFGLTSQRGAEAFRSPLGERNGPAD